MDQYAVACAEAGELLHLDCQTVSHTLVPWNLPQHTLVVMDSRAPRTLAASAYNQRRQECDEASALLKPKGFSGPLAQAPMGLLADALAQTPVLLARARHALSEQLRVRHALRALQLGDAAVLGELLEASHHSLRVDYQVTGPALDTIVAVAMGQPGCLGARMTGAGFGGCAIALVDHDALADFVPAVTQAYQAATGIAPELFAVQPTAGARRLR
jgi:galactokinase